MANPNHGILQTHEARQYGLMLNDYCRQMSNDPDVKISSWVVFNHNMKHRKRTVQYFNCEDHFHEFMMRYANEDGSESSTDRYTVYIGAYAMKRGVSIEKKDLEIIRAALKRIKLHPAAKAQVEKALVHYKSNGERWNFESGKLGSRFASSS